jgi:outer membrane protein assembly factor BamB
VEKVALVYHDKRLYIGTNDGNRGAALSVDATNGDVLKTSFWGVPRPGEIGYDTWGGAAEVQPQRRHAVDPPRGRPRAEPGVLDLRQRARRLVAERLARPGLNLFANSIVALDLKTGEYKWHFQSIHHDIWDMDNVMAPVLADVKIHGKDRKVVVYGSKTGMYYILDRKDGSAPLGIDEVPVKQDARQASWPTQPLPAPGRLDRDLHRRPAAGHRRPRQPEPRRAQLREGLPVRRALGRADPHDPRPRRRRRLEPPVLQPAHRPDVHRHGLRGGRALADRVEQRPAPAGQYQTGAMVAVDPSTNTSVEEADAVLAGARQRHPDHRVEPAVHRPARRQPARDGRQRRRELWRFQTGAAISASPIAYEIDGEQYVAVYAGGTGIPYGNSAPRGDYLWAFKVGGTVAQAATPTPPVVRRPVSGNPVEGAALPTPNTVFLAACKRRRRARCHGVDRA